MKLMRCGLAIVLCVHAACRLAVTAPVMPVAMNSAGMPPRGIKVFTKEPTKATAMT